MAARSSRSRVAYSRQVVDLALALSARVLGGE